MDFKSFFTVFGTILMAELGDKTQLATFLFAAGKDTNKWVVFAGSALGLVTASALGVLAGSYLSEHVNEKYLHYFAGTLFVGLGFWTIFKA
jgi:putative Ca2+/H+ antiporter (TMEM165/GDT1 family)